MSVAKEKTTKFLNSREWRTFLSAAQSATSYPGVVRAFKAGHAWLNESAVKTSGWLFVDDGLAPDPRKTLGI